MQYAFASWIRTPDPEKTPQNIERRRMNIYRELFYNNVAIFVENTFPVAKKVLGQEKWQPLVQTFFAEHLATSPYFREIPLEFMTWLEGALAENPELPPWLMELLHYEWLELEISTRDGEWPESFGKIKPTPDAQICLSPFFEVVAYQFPVHKIAPNYQPATPPEVPTFLAVYRLQNHKVRFSEVTPHTALFLQALTDTPEYTPNQALGVVEELTSQSLGATWLQERLGDLTEREIISGVC